MSRMFRDGFDTGYPEGFRDGLRNRNCNDFRSCNFTGLGTRDILETEIANEINCNSCSRNC